MKNYFHKLQDFITNKKTFEDEEFNDVTLVREANQKTEAPTMILTARNNNIKTYEMFELQRGNFLTKEELFLWR